MESKERNHVDVQNLTAALRLPELVTQLHTLGPRGPGGAVRLHRSQLAHLMKCKTCENKLKNNLDPERYPEGIELLPGERCHRVPTLLEIARNILREPGMTMPEHVEDCLWCSLVFTEMMAEISENPGFSIRGKPVPKEEAFQRLMTRVRECV